MSFPNDSQFSFEKSHELMKEAQKLLPGGVNSPVRAYRAVGGQPVVIDKGSGAILTDVDGNDYIDYVGSFGPLILGHAHPVIVEAVQTTANRGTSFGAPTEMETELASRVASSIPSIEMLRFVNSGTEATMSALRLARAVTNRDLILKFEGCYHGHADGLLAAAGSGVATFALPDSPGVPEAFASQTLLAPYNDLEAVVANFDVHPSAIACVIVEPVAGNMGLVLPKDGFLEGLRELCDRHGTLLLFDEVITGFRVGPGGAQELYGVRPDLTALGKVIGGGLPVGAYGGPRELMKRMAPEGDVYQAGTLAGNPLATAAGIATLDVIREHPDAYQRLEELGSRLEKGLVDSARDTGASVVVNRVGSVLTPFFLKDAPHDYQDVSVADFDAFARFHRSMLQRGVLAPPSQFESWFISLAHDESIIDRTIECSTGALVDSLANTS